MRLVFKIVKKFLLYLIVFLITLLLILWVWNIFTEELSNEETNFGVTFSNIYAEELGLDSRQTYLAILDDLGVKHIRIAAYWSMVEPENNNFNFEELDFEVNEASKRGTNIILGVGQKLPRWPECFIPDWVKEDEVRGSELLEYIETVVTRYKDIPEIQYWQVENEPFLTNFGDCPPLDTNLLDQEIALVRSLDTRPVLTTDSGELGDWIRARSRGDVFGTTMYRDVWFKRAVRFRYPLPPTWFKFKDLATRIILRENYAEKVLVIEMQAEAWGRDPIPFLTLDQQMKYMDFERFKKNIAYSKRAGFPDIYLWGVEWWYYLKETHGIPEFWDYSKELF